MGFLFIWWSCYNKSTTHVRTVTNSVSAKNGGNGYDQNTVTYSGIYWIYNNDAYDNGLYGFEFSYLNGIANVFRNNIGYGNDNGESHFGTGTIESYNSWDSGIGVSSSDFTNTDVSQLLSPRNADGSLPTNITFLHLTSSSHLINSGVNVGLPYLGSAPDLGAFELK